MDRTQAQMFRAVIATGHQLAALICIMIRSRRHNFRVAGFWMAPAPSRATAVKFRAASTFLITETQVLENGLPGLISWVQPRWAMQT